MPSAAETIHAILATRFAPISLSVTDDSAKHAGHAGARAEGETHFSVVIVSSAFEGLRPVARHRLIYDALAGQFQAGLHALAITARTPNE